MLCPTCGKEISNDSEFCPFCGYEIFDYERPSSEHTASDNVDYDDVLGVGNEKTVQKQENSAEQDKVLHGYQGDQEVIEYDDDYDDNEDIDYDEYGEELPEPEDEGKLSVQSIIGIAIAAVLTIIVILLVIQNFSGNSSKNNEQATVTETSEATETPEETAEPSPSEEQYTTMYITMTSDYADMKSKDSDDSSTLTQITVGTAVNYIEEADNGYSKINYKYQDGYIKTENLSETKPTEAEIENMRVICMDDDDIMAIAEQNIEEQYVYMYNMYRGWAYGATYSSSVYVDASGKNWYPVSNPYVYNMACLEYNFHDVMSASANIPDEVSSHFTEYNGQLYTDAETIGDDPEYKSITIDKVKSRDQSQITFEGTVVYETEKGKEKEETFTYVMVPSAGSWQVTEFKCDLFTDD